MKTEIMTITPEMAMNWVTEGNVSNRKMSRSKIDRLASEIKAGRWIVTSQGISFFKDGTLANGQHRLMAIFESGISVQMSVTYGEEPGSALYLDSSESSRSQVDQLKMFGKPWIDGRIIAISRTVIVRSGCISRANMIAIRDVEFFAESFREESELARDWIYNPGKKFLSVAPIAGAVCYSLIANPDRKNDIERFSLAFIEGGAPSLELMSAQKLRDAILLSPRNGMGSMGVFGRDIFLKALRAISAYLDGQIISVLKAPSSIETVKMPKIRGRIEEALYRKKG